MTKKTTTKKLKHDSNNPCDTARNTERVIPDLQQPGGLPYQNTPAWNTTYTGSRIPDECSFQSNYTGERIKELERHSAMLGRISFYIEEFCDERDTTLSGVIKIIAKLKEYEANDIWESYYSERDKQ